MLGPGAGAVEEDEPPALQCPVDDGIREIAVVEDIAPVRERRLVGGEEDGALADVAIVDDVEEDVGGVGSVGQVADLVNDEHMRLRVGRERGPEPPVAAGVGEIVDELRRGDEADGEAVLDRTVPDCNGQMGLSSSSFALEDEVAPLGDQLGAEVAAEQREPNAALKGEVEVVDGFQERKAGMSRVFLHAGLPPVGDFLRAHDGEEVPVGPPLGLGATGELGPVLPGVREAEHGEQALEVEVGGGDRENGRCHVNS